MSHSHLALMSEWSNSDDLSNNTQCFKILNDQWKINPCECLFCIGFQESCREKFIIEEAEIPSVVVSINQNIMQQKHMTLFFQPRSKSHLFTISIILAFSIYTYNSQLNATSSQLCSGDYEGVL